MRPLLPRAEAIVPYLAEIDGARWYTNLGPLVRRLERRLEERLGVPDGGVMTAGNATVALTAGLMALGLPPGALVAVPAWTFCATAHAVVQAGLMPYMMDVDERTWSLSADTVRAALDEGVPLAAVIPVVPFGAPFDGAPWQSLRREAGLPVIVDAAAAFDTWTDASLPAVISLHATKALGAGEGGVLAAEDVDLTARARRICSFGFDGLAIASRAGFNGKMSEYTAAVALAALDAWPVTRRDWLGAAAHYAPLDRPGGVLRQPGFGTQWAGSACVVRLPGRAAQAVGEVLAARGIGTRPWWPQALPDHPAFGGVPGRGVPVARTLARETLGLPLWRDLSRAQAERVMAALAEAVSGECA